jgi:hypothetical protein
MSPKIGDILTASLVSGNNTGTLSYLWRVDGVNAGASSQYTVASVDLGKTITVTISSSVQSGAQTSAATSAVVKDNGPPAPVAPTLSSKTYNSVTLANVTGYEYSKDGTLWQGNVFNALTPSTSYTFYQRVAGTTTTEPSASSTGLNVTTEAAPTGALLGTATINNMSPKLEDTLTASLVSGNNTGTLSYQWKAGGANVGTNANTYTVAAGDLGKTITVSITSSVQTGAQTSATTAAVTKKAGPAAPTAPTLSSKTYNSVTLANITGYEYSINGTSWQASNVFNSLTDRKSVV